MQSGKKRPFDVDAWVQFRLLRSAAFHPETTKADVAVLAEIIQRYHGQYGNGWASHEHLAAMTGVSLPTVKRAKKSLERLGFVTVLAGGRRGSATVYLPNFALVARKGITDDTESFGVKDDTEMMGKGISDDTETLQKGITDEPPSYLPDRPTRAGSQIDRDDCAAPLAPPAVGLAATTAGSAQGGFEELRLSYYPDGKSRNIADERRAYSSLEPDANLHAEMVEAARAWYAAWSAQADTSRPRFSLSRWIREEHYRNAPPTGFKPKERKAGQKVKSKESASRDPFTERRELLTVVGSNVVVDSGELTLYLDVVDEAGQLRDIAIDLECKDAQAQERGQKEYRKLLEAVGLHDIDDSSELHGARFTRVLRSKFGDYEYEPAPANDSEAASADLLQEAA